MLMQPGARFSAAGVKQQTSHKDDTGRPWCAVNEPVPPCPTPLPRSDGPACDSATPISTSGPPTVLRPSLCSALCPLGPLLGALHKAVE